MIWIFLSVLLTLGLVALGVINKTNQSQMRSKVTREAKDAYNRAERNGTSPEELQSMQADLDRYCKDAIDGAKVLIPGIVVGVGWTCVCVFLLWGCSTRCFSMPTPLWCTTSKLLVVQNRTPLEKQVTYGMALARTHLGNRV